MAALGILAQDNTAGYTDITASYVDCGSGLTLGASGKTYLIIGVAQATSDNTLEAHRVRMTIDGTEAPGSEQSWEHEVLNKGDSWYYQYKYTTTNSSEVVKIQHRRDIAAETSEVNTACIRAIPLDGLAATDWFYAQDDDRASPVSLGNNDEASFASVTFTPANGTDDWLIIANATINISNTAVPSTNYRIGIKESVGATIEPYISQEGEDESPEEIRLGMTSKVFTLSAAEHTISTWCDNDTSATQNEHLFSSIFCLRLNAFEQHFDVYDSGEYDLAAANTWEQLNRQTFTPDTTGAWMGVISAAYIATTTPNNGNIRCQVDDTTTYPTNFDTGSYEGCSSANDPTHEGCMVTIPYISSLTASTSYNLDVDFKSNSASLSGNAGRRSYVYFSDELASAGPDIIVGTAGAVVFSGLAPSVQTGVDVDAPAGAVVFSGLAPSVQTGVDVDAPAGAVVFSGLAPSVQTGVDVDAPAGAVVFSGLAPSVQTGVDVDAPAGAVVFSGLVPSVSITGAGAVDVASPAGAVVFSGLVPSVQTGVGVDAPAGAVVFSGLAPSVQTGVDVDAPTGAVVFSGLAPSVQTGVDVDAPAGAVVFSGLAPTITAAPVTEIQSPAGAVVFSGLAPSVQTGVNVDVTTGAVIINGFAPVIEIPSAAEISPPAGAVNITGFAPQFFNVGPFTITAGMYDIGPLGRTQRPFLPYGTILTDRVDGNTYIIDRPIDGTVRLSTVTFKNGLRTYRPFSPYGGPVINNKRLYSENGVLMSEAITGHIVNSSPVNTLVTTSADLYELEYSNGELVWTAV